MRWKLLKRRLSVSAPRVSVRSRMPWPLRWMLVAMALGFSAALALWAYQTGREFAGVNPHAAEEVRQLREELDRLRQEHSRAVSLASSADSLLKAEKTAQESLAARVKALEAENLALTRDVAFAERLGAKGGDGGAAGPVAIRGLSAELQAVGRVHYQALLVLRQGQSGEFTGRVEMHLSGMHEGKPWSQGPSGSASLVLKPYQRLDGAVDFPKRAVLKQLDVKVFDRNGKWVVTESVRL